MSEQVSIDEHGRPEPPLNEGELATLVGFLEYQRATFRWRVSGVGSEGLRTSVASSSMTLGGMMKHLALVEDHWFSRVLTDGPDRLPWSAIDWTADPDWDWESARDDEAQYLWQLWEDAVEQSRAHVASVIGAGGDGSTGARRSFSDGSAPSLRWILCHMIEEYARHNGHADLLREAIDGVVGE